MDLVIADSSFYIHSLRAKRQPFAEMEQLADRIEWATMGMVVLEVCRGLREPALRDAFEVRYSTMVFLPTSPSVWERATRLAWTLDRKGWVIPAQDIVIAATCLSFEARLLTHNAHFSEIPGLVVVSALDDLKKG